MSFIAVCLFSFLFVYCKSPSAEPFRWVSVGRTADAFGADSVINGLGEAGVFDEPSAFARVIDQAFSDTG